MANTVEQLQRKRRGIDVKANGIKILVSKFKLDTTKVGVVDFRLKEISDLKVKLTEYMDEVSELCVDDTTYETAIKEFKTTNDLLNEVEGEALAFKDTLAPEPSCHATTKVQEVKLPQLDLPSFSGDRME